jgi:phenylpropionate dioxygenase-like ring-hydroxylating dioxygenase large terminal subunit
MSATPISSLMSAKESKLAHAQTEASLVFQAPLKFRVHTRAYTDHAIFETEMERIYSRTWVYVGHESEIPNPGDFKTTHIGLQPVIVTRSQDGTLNVMVNRCVHRGAVVCREARGNAARFNCPYHGWVYDLSGKLKGVSERHEQGGYGENFEPPKSLYRLPRVDAYRGLIFASFNSDVSLLKEWLGKAKDVIDRKFDLSPSGEIVLKARPYVSRYKGNWKFQYENLVDPYHFMHTHKGFVKLQFKYGDSTGDYGVHKGGSAKDMRAIRMRGASWSCRNGHAVIEKPASSSEPFLHGENGEYFRQLHDKYGEEQFLKIAGQGSTAVFPNLGMIHQQLRVWRPIAPDMTEVTVYLYELKDAPDSFNEGMLRSQERFYGPAGYGQSDDVEIFSLNQQGLAGSAVEWLILERGIETDVLTDEGDYRGLPASEAPQRALWREWDHLMNGTEHAR